MERYLEQFKGLIDYQLAGNTVADWLVAVAVFVAMFIALELVRKVAVVRLVKLAKRTNSRIDDIISGFLNSIKWPIFGLIAIFFALQGVELPESINLILDIAILVVIVSQAIRILEEIAVFLLLRQLRANNSDAELPAVFRIALRLLLWSVGALLILSNAGVDITSLVAGLGIGGLAVSLALQNILSDLFSSFSIAIDKPFAIGDFIIVGDHKGTVKHIGLKTTRITALEGEEIVISNAELTSARVQNYKKMQQRRIVFTFGATYDAKPEQMKKVAEDVAKIIDDHDQARVDRVHFKEFGGSELVFEAVYYMETNDYQVYMDTQEDINVKIMEYYQKNGLEMAFPTQTVHLVKEA